VKQVRPRSRRAATCSRAAFASADRVRDHWAASLIPPRSALWANSMTAGPAYFPPFMKIALSVVLRSKPILRRPEFRARQTQNCRDVLDAYDLVLPGSLRRLFRDPGSRDKGAGASGAPPSRSIPFIRWSHAFSAMCHHCLFPARRTLKKVRAGLDPPCSGSHPSWPGLACSDFRRVFHRMDGPRSCLPCPPHSSQRARRPIPQSALT